MTLIVHILLNDLVEHPMVIVYLLSLSIVQMDKFSNYSTMSEQNVSMVHDDSTQEKNISSLRSPSIDTHFTPISFN